MCSEYAAVKNLISAIGRIAESENDKVAVIRIISLSKLMAGGAAMFAPANKNHHKDMIGVTDIRPLVRKILRVFVISYDMFAKINSAEDLSP